MKYHRFTLNLHSNILSRAIISFCFSLVIGLPFAQASIQDELSPEQWKELKSGKQVSIFEDVGGTWPKCRIFQKVQATPEEAVAVFHDYERHQEFFAGITQSEILQIIDPATKDVQYRMEVALPLGFGHLDEVYSVRDHVEKGQSNYLVSWNLLHSDSSKSSVGSLTVEPFEADHSIIAYETYAEPDRIGSGFGWVIKGVKKAAQEAARTYVDRVHQLKASASPVLQEELEMLREALNH